MCIMSNVKPKNKLEVGMLSVFDSKNVVAAKGVGEQ